MKVKVCGITRPEDVKLMESSKADLIGFIHIPRSARFVSLDEICKLTSSMKNKDKSVLVMETEDINEIENAVEKTGINMVQFHSLSSQDIEKFKVSHPSFKIIRSIGISPNFSQSKADEIKNYALICDFLLFDFEMDGKSGGTGKQIPLKDAVKAAKIARKYNSKVKLFLAGGINTNRIKNEGEILKNVFDYADVNSGVEEEPGIKNEDKIKEFMQVMK